MDQNLTTAQTDSQWFCIRSQPRRERIASAQLAMLPEVKVLYPRARYERKGPKGKRLVTEPMFPSYLFAKFNPKTSLRAVCYAKGVAYIVKRGEDVIPVPKTIIGELESITDDGMLDMPSAQLLIGDTIKVVSGIFIGTEAEIIGLVPARERIQILLEILGRETVVEIGMDQVDRPVGHPLSRG